MSGAGGDRPPHRAVLLGYFAKRLVRPPQWMRERGIDEIASVSLCIAGGPEGWLDEWKHNSWGFFADPATAWSRVAPDHRAHFRIYAYALHPFEVRDGREEPIDVDEPKAEALTADFERVGWDVVSRSAGQHFECSPLSCNLLAHELVTNRYCLFPELGSARDLARTADARRCEPGPYHVLEVWRHQ